MLLIYVTTRQGECKNVTTPIPKSFMDMAFIIIIIIIIVINFLKVGFYICSWVTANLRLLK